MGGRGNRRAHAELKLDGLLNLRLARRTIRSDNGDHHKEHCGWQSRREDWLNQLGGEVRFGIGWQWRGMW